MKLTEISTDTWREKAIKNKKNKGGKEAQRRQMTEQKWERG